MELYTSLQNIIISPDETLELAKSLKQHQAIRVGYNAIIHNAKTLNGTNCILKVCLSGEQDFLKEVYAMTVLSRHEICPRVYEYYWSNNVFKLSDLASKEDIVANKKIRKSLDKDEVYEGVGFIYMEEILNPQPAYATEGFFKKTAMAYSLGFICQEPDLVTGINPNGDVISRILDWGNWPENYVCNFEEFMVTIGYIKTL